MTGAATLLRLMLRRDRLRLSLWAAGIGLMGFYFANAVQVITEDEAELAQLAGMFADPVGRLMTGPAFGMDEPTFERFFAAGYVLFLYILVALMSVFTVVRHTRAEEQTGRAELVRANVVGRHATLSAALLLVVGANVIAAALIVAGALSGGYAAEGSVLVGAGALAVGLFFSGAAATAAQMSESSRGASAMAGGLLGLAYLIRMGGDMAEQGGTALSWASPLGWAQQTAPYVEDRWWPLALLLGGAALLAALGFWLSTRRDVEASLMPTRLGRRSAGRSLGTPLGMAARILRGGLRGWGLALVLCGLLFGSYAQALVDAADELPAEIAMIFSGESMMLGYLAYMALFMAIFVTAAGVSGLHQLRGEETRGRAELGLSVPMSRSTWLGAHLTVLLGGLVLILLLVGVAMGAGAAAVLEDGGGRYFGELVMAALHQAPAALAVIGIVVALFGWLPRAASAVGWVIIGYGAVMTNFGQLLELPEVVYELNVFGHLSQYPVEEVSWAPVAVLTGIGAAGIALGFLGWNRREVNRV
ncbi:ABC transporter permease [Nesterenkonia populi]